MSVDLIEELFERGHSIDQAIRMSNEAKHEKEKMMKKKYGAGFRFGVNLIDHFLQGTVWEVPSKGNPNNMNKVTLGPNDLWCTCKRFDYWSNCSHCDHVRHLIAGHGMPKWEVE